MEYPHHATPTTCMTAAGLLTPATDTDAAATTTTPADAASEAASSPGQQLEIDLWQHPRNDDDDDGEPYIPLITLDEHGHPPFYRECLDAIIYSMSIMTTLIQAFTQPFYHATCPQFALCLSNAAALKPSPPPSPRMGAAPTTTMSPAPAAPCPITFSYSGDRAAARSQLPGLDVAHERELFYITSSVLQITRGSEVTLRLAENYLNRIAPLLTQLRAHKRSEEQGHDDCCWTLASLAPLAEDASDADGALPSCATSHPPLFRKDGSHLVLNDRASSSSSTAHTSPAAGLTLPLKLDADGHLARECFTQPCHALPDASLRILLDRPVMTLTVALVLAAKTVHETGSWMRRVAHTTVQNLAELHACERALLRALRWDVGYVPVPGVDSPAIAETLTLRCGAGAGAGAAAAGRVEESLTPILKEAPTYYQCIPWMLWQYANHDGAATHAAIANTFMRPCSHVPREVQAQLLEHLAWLSRTVHGVLLPAEQFAAPQQQQQQGDRDERKRLDLLVGLVERPPLGPMVVRARSKREMTARKRASRTLKAATSISVRKAKRAVDADAI